MSSDLQANITGRDNGASAAIDQATKAMERLEKQTRKTTKEAKDLQREVKEGYKKSGEAVSKAGGPLGSVGGRILGGVGMDGNIGRAAVGFAVASLAFSALNKVIEVGIAKTQLLIDARKQLNAAEDSAAKIKDGQAISGAGQAGTIRGVLSQGGSFAEEMLKKIETSGVQIGQGDAANGLGAIFKALRSQGLDINGKESRFAVDTGIDMARRGMPFGEAMTGLGQGDLRNDHGVRRRAVRLYGNSIGAFGDSAGEAYNGALSNTMGSDEANAVLGKLPGIDRDSTKSNGVSAARDQVGKATDPGSAAMLALFKVQQQQLADLSEMAQAQGKVFGLLADVFKPEGSFETQIRRINNAQASAQFAPGR
jgi:hypothetical protein